MAVGLDVSGMQNTLAQQNPAGLAAASTNAQPALNLGNYAPATTDASASNPLQPSYLPTPPTAEATTYNASTYDPATASSTGYNAALYNNGYNPQTATSEINAAAGVQDQQQNANLMSMLAAQGISPGSSAAQAAAQNLATQQTAALAPSLVNAQEYGAGLNEQSGLSNQSALNSASQFGAGAYNTAALSNQNAYNTAGQYNAGALNSAGQYNAGASNTMTQQNLQDLLQTQEYNANAYNNAGLTSAGYQNQDWLAELQAQLGLQQTGLSTAGSLAGDQATQQVPLNPSLFSDITSGVGAAASAAAPFSGSFGGGGGSAAGGGGGTGSYNNIAGEQNP